MFLERGEGREKERERNIDVRERETLISHLSYAPLKPATQAWDLASGPVGLLLLRDDAYPAEPHWPGLQAARFKYTFSSTVPWKGSPRPVWAHSCSQLQSKIMSHLRLLVQFGAGHLNSYDIENMA